MNEINCQTAQENLPLYVSGDCDADMEKNIALHLESCKSCQAEYQELKNIIGKFQDTNVSGPGETYWHNFSDTIAEKVDFRNTYATPKKPETTFSLFELIKSKLFPDNNFSLGLGMGAVATLALFITIGVMLSKNDHTLDPMNAWLANNAQNYDLSRIVENQIDITSTQAQFSFAPQDKGAKYFENGILYARSIVVAKESSSNQILKKLLDKILVNVKNESLNKSSSELALAISTVSNMQDDPEELNQQLSQFENIYLKEIATDPSAKTLFQIGKWSEFFSLLLEVKDLKAIRDIVLNDKVLNDIQSAKHVSDNEKSKLQELINAANKKTMTRKQIRELKKKLKNFQSLLS